MRISSCKARAESLSFCLLDICSILPIGAPWMALRVQTQISGDVFILRCEGRIVFGDECAILRERVVKMLPGSPKIVVDLAGVDHIDSEGLGMLVLPVDPQNYGQRLVSAKTMARRI